MFSYNSVKSLFLSVLVDNSKKVLFIVIFKIMQWFLWVQKLNSLQRFLI
jgi:hypothetical protein